jgi:hypothetical protein
MSYAARILETPNLQGYWRLGESSGSVLDYASTHPGTVSGGVTRAAVGALASKNKAATFDGSTGRVVMTGFNATGAQTALTFEAWIKSDGSWAVGHETIICAGSAGHYLSVNTGKLFMSLQIAGVQRLTTSAVAAAVPTTGFHHVVGTWTSGDLMRVYLDGRLVDSSGPWTGSLSGALPLGLGCFDPGGAGSGFYGGTIDEAALYNRALDLGEILDRVNGISNTAELLKLTIAGVDKTRFFYLPDGQLSGTVMAGARGSFQVKVFDTLDAAGYRPNIDDTISVDYDLDALFAGRIDDVEEESLTDLDTGLITTITASDWQAIPDQVVYSASYPVGTLLKTILQDLVTNKLAAYGVTLDAAQANGPALSAPLTVDKESGTSILNRLQTLSGWVWRIDTAKKLRAIQAGTVACGFSLGDATNDVLGRVSWRKARATNYINKILLKIGTEQIVPKTDTITGNGVLTSWTLAYTPVPSSDGGFIVSRGLVHEGAADLPLGKFGVDPTTWTYDPATNTLHRSSALGLGVVATFLYQVQFPITVTYEDTVESAAHGAYEAQIDAPDVFDKTEGLVLATALVRRGIATPKTVIVRTTNGGAIPGQTVPLSFAAHGLIATYMIVAVDVQSADDGSLEYTLTCLEGSELADSWLDYYRRSGGGVANGGGGTVSGAFLPTISGLVQGPVTAWSGTSGLESSLDYLINGSNLGPALILGRGADQWAWAMSADTLGGAGGTQARLRFTPLKENSSLRFAMQLAQDPVPVASQYFLTPTRWGRSFSAPRLRAASARASASPISTRATSTPAPASSSAAARRAWATGSPTPTRPATSAAAP